MHLKTPALVLRVTDYKEHDALLTVLTPNHGKMTVKARGLRLKNSPLVAHASCWPTENLYYLNTGDSTPSTKHFPSNCFRVCGGIL